jgi:alkylhydroperoxidase/carboxymuconolactone decarboxylase family protein YurZ
VSEASKPSTASAVESSPIPPGPDAAAEAAEEQASRALLSELGPAAPAIDLTRTVPDLINRRSQGRFFGRRSLADRLPLEWISLAMLISLGVLYTVLQLVFVD